MPELLRPTNPVPGYDSAPVRVTVPAPGDTSVQNIVDPSRVTRADQRTDQDQQSATDAARYESNFMTFLQRLQGTRETPDSFMRVLQWGGQVTSGVQEGFAAELAQLVEFLKLDEGQLLEFLKNQLQSGSRFSGTLFQVLRDAYSSGSSFSQADILQFLRRYSDFTSTEHLEGNILRAARDMTESIPNPWKGQLSGMLARLENGVAAGDRQGNLDILRSEIFRTVAKYVSTTHDHGRARGLLSQLSLDVARYENGDENGLTSSFRHLVSTGVLPEELGKLSDQEILQLLRDGDYQKASAGNRFADQLAALIDSAVRGRGGVDAQEAFQNIMRAILINESVYMPVNHAMIPIDWNGKKAFSEVWVDPDAENGNRPGEGRGTRLLIKMDIQSLGAFDLLISTVGDSVSLQVACPRDAAPFSEDITRSLETILSRNGLRPEQVRVGEMRRSIAVSEVFPKIFERMSGVNVRA
ncbi:MAG: hypothetical protein IJT94_12500 [Oscillibacter sp.]|nr:hypothetical protein [Oscillibacter sp.]